MIISAFNEQFKTVFFFFFKYIARTDVADYRPFLILIHASFFLAGLRYSTISHLFKLSFYVSFHSFPPAPRPPLLSLSAGGSVSQSWS